MPVLTPYILPFIAGLLLLLTVTDRAVADFFTWQPIDQGLMVQEFPVTGGVLTAVRIDPRYWRFELGCAQKDKTKPKSVHAWLEEKQFTALINASMFKEDGITSTGYMREGKSVNNPRISSRFGAFFVANPDRESLAQATLLERDIPNLADTLSHYSLVVQNYRLLSENKTVLWPKTGKKHAIAAVAQDKDGHILFLYTNAHMLPADFAKTLLGIPLNIGTTMYVEGGSEAALLFKEGETVHARYSYFEPVLPNILGIRKKETP